MSCTKTTSIYDKTLLLPVYDDRGITADRNLNIQVTSNLTDTLRIKLRDTSEFSFNYTETIDAVAFETLRSNQSLDINFHEFKLDLIEMLQQFERKEMFLKCEISENYATLVFFLKSKIKHIVYLSLELKLTNQREILNEMNNNLLKAQEMNENLKRGLKNMQNSLLDKEKQIQLGVLDKKQTITQFGENLKQIKSAFTKNVINLEQLLSNRICNMNERMLRLLEEVKTIKQETSLKCDSSARLAASMENLRLETIENATIINQLKKENSTLYTLTQQQKKQLTETIISLDTTKLQLEEMQKSNDLLRHDLETSTAVIAQRQATNDELTQDLIQANQMLVNFNKHYDMKAQEVEELQKALKTKDGILHEQKELKTQVLKEFEAYRLRFNGDVEMKMKQELGLARCKIAELEEAVRKANKMNTLLTGKVNAQNNNPFA